MGKRPLKTHIKSNDGKSLCGIFLYHTHLSTEIVKDADCKICVHKERFDRGAENEWKIGGSYTKTGELREEKVY